MPLPVSADQSGVQVAAPHPLASKASTDPSSDPANTTPPATAGWTRTALPVAADHWAAQVTAPQPSAGNARTSPLPVGTYSVPSASAGSDVTPPATEAVHRTAPSLASIA